MAVLHDANSIGCKGGSNKKKKKKKKKKKHRTSCDVPGKTLSGHSEKTDMRPLLKPYGTLGGLMHRVSQRYC
jgi:hypothetical protein